MQRPTTVDGRMSNQVNNFLPDSGSSQTPYAGGNRLNCLKRGKEVPATPEELVRQRVLHWLIHRKGWARDNIRLEGRGAEDAAGQYLYKWESDPNRKRIRPDIELLDDGRKVLVVIECKHEGVPLSPAVDAQAMEYAIKSGAPYIWITNGREHRFLVPSPGGAPKPVTSIEPLGETYEPPTGEISFPFDASDVKQYLNEHRLSAVDDPHEKRFILAVHHAIFEAAAKRRAGKKLPYSFGGVHILEYIGPAFYEFSNRSGGRYYTRYADFIAATRGRAEALSIGVNPWKTGGIRLCVGVTKPERVHHALQLNFANCEWNQKKRLWRVYHKGRLMSQISNEVVLTSVREANCAHWIDRGVDGKERVYLGDLPDVGTKRPAPWKFLARLLHYAIIRTNLREAHAAKPRAR